MKLNFDELVKQEIINLKFKGLRDDDLDILYKVIEQSTVLEELNLSLNYLTLADGKLANAIAKNTTLKELYIFKNNISQQGIKHLANALKENNTLEVLSLACNNIGDEGAKCIAEVLAGNKTLQWIHLGNNNIGDEGAKSIATSLTKNTGINTIHLDCNKIGDQGAEKLADALESNNNIEDLTFDMLGPKMYNNICDHTLARIKAILDDPKRKQFAMLKWSIAMKDKELEDKDAEIASLKESLKNSKPIDIVDLTDTTSSKRPRTEDTPDAAKSGLAIQHEQNQRIVQVKEEKVAAETSLMSVREEKQRIEDEKELALECKICFEVKEERYALVPCGHIMCSVCKDNYRECPTCSRHVDSHLRVHL